MTSTGAIFTGSAAEDGNALGTKHIFPGERVTSAFDVRDVSGGAAEVDRSSPFAVASDARTVRTSAWPSTFVAANYVQFDMNAPLPGGIGAYSAAFRFRFASSMAGAAACVYVEVRSISSGSVLATYGSSASPVACVTGTALTSTVTALPIVNGTDVANDLRIRVLGRDTGGNAMVIDEARLTGSTPNMSFSLYPVRYTDAADGTAVSTPWELQGP